MGYFRERKDEWIDHNQSSEVSNLAPFESIDQSIIGDSIISNGKRKIFNTLMIIWVLSFQSTEKKPCKVSDRSSYAVFRIMAVSSSASMMDSCL